MDLRKVVLSLVREPLQHVRIRSSTLGFPVFDL